MKQRKMSHQRGRLISTTRGSPRNSRRNLRTAAGVGASGVPSWASRTPAMLAFTANQSFSALAPSPMPQTMRLGARPNFFSKRAESFFENASS